MDPAPDRRPGGRRLALPPRRDRLHRDRGLLALDADRDAPTRRRSPASGTTRSRPWSTSASGSSGSSRPLRTAGRSACPSFGGQVTIGGLWSTSNDPALEIDRTPGDKRRSLLAGDDLRHVHPDRLDDDRAADRRTARPARTCSPGRSTRSRRAPSATAVDLPDHAPELAASTSCSARSIRCRSIATATLQPVRRRTASSSRSRSGADAVHDPGVHPDRRRRARRGDAEPAPGRRHELPAGHHRPLPRDPEGRDGAGGDAALQRHHGHGEGRRRPTTPFDIAEAIVDRAPRRSQFHYETNVLGVCDEYVEHRRVLRRRRSRGSASTTRARWRSSSARPASRPGSSRGSCPATSIRRPARRRSGPAAPMPGSRCTSRATAGRCSTRPAAVSRTPDAARGKVVPIASATPVPTFGRSSDDPEDDINLRSRRAGRASAPARRAAARNLPGLIIVSVVLLAVRAGRWPSSPGGAGRGRATSAGRGLHVGGRHRPAVRLRAAPDPDRVRVRGRPRRRPAERPAGAPDRGDREGRGRVRAPRARRGPDPDARASRTGGCASRCSGSRSGARDRRRMR